MGSFFVVQFVACPSPELPRRVTSRCSAKFLPRTMHPPFAQMSQVNDVCVFEARAGRLFCVKGLSASCQAPSGKNVSAQALRARTLASTGSHFAGRVHDFGPADPTFPFSGICRRMYELTCNPNQRNPPRSSTQPFDTPVDVTGASNDQGRQRVSATLTSVRLE